MAPRGVSSLRAGVLSLLRAAASTPAPSRGLTSRLRVARLTTATTRRCGRSGSRKRVSQARRLPPGRSTAYRAMQDFLGEACWLRSARVASLLQLSAAWSPHQPGLGWGTEAQSEGPASPTHPPAAAPLPSQVHWFCLLPLSLTRNPPPSPGPRTDPHSTDAVGPPRGGPAPRTPETPLA